MSSSQNPSLRPSPSNTIPDSIPETSGDNLGGHSSSDKSLSGNEGDITIQGIYDLCLSLCKQVSDQAKEIQALKAQITKLKKQAKPVIKHHKEYRKEDPLFDEIPEDKIDHMETENAQSEGRTREIVDEDKEIDKLIIHKMKVIPSRKEYSTDFEKHRLTDQYTAEQREGTEEKVESTDGQKNKAKAVSREKEKCVELKDVEETDRPKPTSTRSLLTLKPLLKIDPKDKGKKKIGERWNESDRDRHVGNYKHAELKIKKFEEVQALYEKIKRSDEDFISIGSAEDERLIKKMNEKGVDLSKSEVIKEESKEEVQEEVKDEESTRKRKIGTRKKMKSRKRRYIQYTSEDSDKENDELRFNGQKRYFSTLMTVLSIFDREDLNAVYQLVMEKYQDEMPEGFDRVLWGDLMVLFNPDDKDEF
ncbi:hypothetical protein Tco_0471747 [Tanacetum coccineum]